MRTVLFLILCLVLASCSSISSLTMDFLYPSELSFPPQIKSVAVVDNVANRDTLYAKNLATRELEGNGKIMAEQLASSIAEGEYFDDVMLCNSSLRSGNNVDNDAKLPREQVKDLLGDLEVDMLVVIDKITVKLTPQVRKLPNGDVPLDVLMGEVKPEISVYTLNRVEPISFAVESEDQYLWNLSAGRVTEREAVEELSKRAAQNVLKYLVPQWKTEELYYYSDGCMELRDAAVFVRSNKWEEAYALWKKLYEASKPDSKKRMWAAFNIALYYELQGNIKEALRYAGEANRLAAAGSGDKSLIDSYCSKHLSDKELKVTKLNLQMQRFE